MHKHKLKNTNITTNNSSFSLLKHNMNMKQTTKKNMRHTTKENMKLDRPKTKTVKQMSVFSRLSGEQLINELLLETFFVLREWLCFSK